MGGMVTLMCMKAQPPVILSAEVLTASAEGVRPALLTLLLRAGDSAAAGAAALGLAAGQKAVLDFPAPSGEPRRVVRITSVEGWTVSVEIQLSRADHRDAARVNTAVELAYLPVPAGADPEAWYAGGEIAGSPPLHRPDPFMNLSMTGLQFEDALICQENDLLLMRFSLPHRRRTWRALGRVVRVREIPEDQRSEPGGEPGGPDAMLAPTHLIAVRFERLPDEARKALVAQTRRVQGTLIGV